MQQPTVEKRNGETVPCATNDGERKLEAAQKTSAELGAINGAFAELWFLPKMDCTPKKYQMKLESFFFVWAI